MPQLNPSPWFLIMALSWVALFLLFKNKTTVVIQQNQTTPTSLKTDPKSPWTWPWI
uniref:ATP synthase complex subunit 8 n=1 Tax=Lygosoma sp. CDS-2011 TaxID=979844 RepID=F2YDW0_9SAUR|nr:ATPase 8 [Lygosoma sp. CDS-2011]